MTNEYRLSSGGQINRSESISFKFNGKTLYGFKGDTLASALLANGIHLVGRSFKSVSYTHLTLPTNREV